MDQSLMLDKKPVDLVKVAEGIDVALKKINRALRLYPMSDSAFSLVDAAYEEIFNQLVRLEIAAQNS